MCDPIPGNRCPHDAAAAAGPTEAAYREAHPHGPNVHPLTSSNILTMNGTSASGVPTPVDAQNAPDAVTRAWAEIVTRKEPNPQLRQALGRELVADVTTFEGKFFDDHLRAMLASASNNEFDQAMTHAREVALGTPRLDDQKVADIYLQQLMQARIAGEYAYQLGHARREGAHDWEFIGDDKNFCRNCRVTAARVGDPRFVWPCD